MVSIKIHGAVAVVAVLFLGALLPSHASTGKPATYNHAAPAPAPAPTSYPPPSIQPVIIVQGVIYCKSCNLSGAYNRNMDASPLPNATAKLVCYGGEESGYRVLNATSTTTDKNGYFLVMVYDLGVFSRRSCRVYLGSSPTRLCATPFIPANAALGLTLVRDDVKRLPEGVRGVYRPRSALMYGPSRNGKCPE